MPELKIFLNIGRMNINQISKNKKEDMKSFKKFIVIVILSGVIGGFVGFVSNYIDVNAVHFIGGNVSSFLVYAIPIFLVAMNVIVLVINFLLSKQAKKGLNAWDGTYYESRRSSF